MRAYGLVFLAILLFSGNFIAGKLASETIPPFTLAWLRTLAALILMTTFARKQFKLVRSQLFKEWKPLYGMALTGVVLFPALVYLALRYTTTINASIVEALTPSIAVMLSFIFLKERYKPRQVVGVVISFLGVVYIISNGSVSVLLHLSFNIGDLIMIAAVLSWAFYSVLVNNHASKFPLYGSLLMMLIMGNITLLILAGALEWSRGAFPLHWNIPVLLSVLYIGIFPAVIALLAWNYAVSQIGPARASVFLNLIPLTTAGLSFIFLDEWMSWEQLLGGIIVITGVYLTTYTRQKAKGS